MKTYQRLPLALFAAALIAALAAGGCGSKSPTTPTTSGTISDVSLNAGSVSTGATVEGSVKLTAAATEATSVVLSSSNPAVATVQTPVTIASGASSATFTVTAVAPGTATIMASLNGGSRQSPALTVAAGTILSSIAVNVSTITGGDAATGTATLSAAAAAAGAVVSLTATDPVTVPASVTVPAGATSATFPVTTHVVSGQAASVTITGSFGGVSKSATLEVTAPTAATARFGVTGPTESETCTLTNGGNTIDCSFNGTTSTAPGAITAWDWTYSVATTLGQTTSGPILTNPTVSCSFVPPPPFPAGTSWFTMTVTLVVHDNAGNTSAKAVNSGVRLIPQAGVCGY
jgi:trimeric autotransporter adhesin